MRNAQPTSFGGSGSRPLLPLDVRFLITPWTPVPRDSYRIIGAIAIVLAHSAVLGFGDLEGGPDIWAPDDTVALVLESIPIEEHYDIWEPTGVPYRLSLTYLARVMGLDPATAPGGPPVVLAKLAPVPA